MTSMDAENIFIRRAVIKYLKLRHYDSLQRVKMQES